jgi:peptidoglycan/LPS O-acetylase OafA/YrhL
MNSTKKLNSLQAYRAAAAIIVLFYHETQHFQKFFSESFLGNVFEQGYLGVDYFFVLSGFIIPFTCWKMVGKKQYLGDYLRKRFVRIYPIYWVYLLGIIGLFLIVPHLVPNNDFFRLSTLPATFLLIFKHNAILTTSWSLSHEIFFYVMFGLLIFNRHFLKIIWVIIGMALINMIFSLNDVYLFGKNSFTDTIFSSLNIEFCFGVVAFAVWDKLSVRAARIMFPLSLLLLITSQLFLVSNHYDYIRDARVILFGIPAFLSLISVVKLERYTRMRIPGIFVLLGDASYTIYLIHRPILSAMNSILITRMHWVLLNKTVTNFVFIAIVLGLCILLYKVLEQPLTNRLARLLKPKQTVPADTVLPVAQSSVQGTETSAEI